MARCESEDFGWHLPVPLAEIRPTQMAVGMRAVEAKRRKIERLSGSTRKLRRFLEKRRIPAVIGPGENYYIIDHHHLSLALWQSEIDEVFVRVIGDFSDMPKPAFLHAMAAFGWLHACDARGRNVCPTRLPASLDQLRADLYNGQFSTTYLSRARARRRSCFSFATSPRPVLVYSPLRRTW